MRDRLRGSPLRARPPVQPAVLSKPAPHAGDRQPPAPLAADRERRFGHGFSSVRLAAEARNSLRLTAGRLARQEWQSLFSRHLVARSATETDSPHSQYLYSRRYGWIDATPLFAQIAYAEDQDPQPATAQDPVIQPTRSNEAAPDTPELGENIDRGDQDPIASHVGSRWFGLHGAFINAGSSDAEVRDRFVVGIEQLFADIEVVNDPAAVAVKASNLTAKEERWSAPKSTLPEAKAQNPELFRSSADMRLRIAVYDTRAAAERGQKELMDKLPTRAPPISIAPYGQRWTLNMEPLTRGEALYWKQLVDSVIAAKPGGALVEVRPK